MKKPNIIVSWVSAKNNGSDTAFYMICLYQGKNPDVVDSRTVDDLSGMISPIDCCRWTIIELVTSNGFAVEDVSVEYDL